MPSARLVHQRYDKYQAAESASSSNSKPDKKEINCNRFFHWPQRTWIGARHYVAIAQVES